jgi:hypothetical protein
MPQKTVKFAAKKVVRKPVRVKFRTKSGQTVSFKAVRTIERPATARFAAKTK